MGSLDRLKDISGFMAGFPLDDTLGSATTRAIGGMLGTVALEIEREREQSAECGSCADAAEWVEEHGGLDAVIERWAGSVPAAHVKKITAGWKEKRDRLIAHARMLEHLLGERRRQVKQLNKTVAEMRPRLMPEGMEWPRYESGEPVEFGGKGLDIQGAVRSVNGVKFTQGGFVFISDDMGRPWWANDQGPTEDPCVDPAKRVKRPAPKALAADGMEIREKGDAWWICEGDERGVHAERLRVETICPNGLVECSPYNGGTWVYLEPSELYVNKPVPASDGIPLREGETVWGIGRTQHEFVVLGQPGLGGGSGRFKVVCHDVTDGVDCDCDPSLLTHERPENKCRDCAHWQKDPTADRMGVCWFYYHEYEGQDCYAARLADIGACEEFVRRAKALAGASE